MSCLPEDLWERLQRHAHYRDVDYQRLADRYGVNWLVKRVERQLAIYEAIQFGRTAGVRRGFRRLYRQTIRSGLWMLGQYRKAKAMADNPQRVEREQILSRLPKAFDGFRILHLSDFHFDFMPDLSERLAPVLKDLSADVTVLTGDFRGETFGPYAESLEQLRRLRPHLGSTVYAVLGNHDNAEILLDLPGMSIQPLVNEAVWIDRKNDRLLLAGIDDPHYYQTHHFTPFEPEVAQAACSILLAHSPEVFSEAERAGLDFVLCGHTHGGQVCFPGGYPVITHIGRTPKHLVSGPWRWGALAGYTSRGVGASSLPLRWHCPPEVTVHTLRCR